MGVRKVLIDTNVYVAFKRDESEVSIAFKRFDVIGLDVTVLAELYSGFKEEKKRSKMKKKRGQKGSKRGQVCC